MTASGGPSAVADVLVAGAGHNSLITAWDRETVEVVSAGVAGWPEDVLRMGRDVCEGRLVHD
jgi:hypothetical protein